ncbi:MAG: hypothetical protein EOO62_37635, partial [Hymenobacter sp.]
MGIVQRQGLRNTLISYAGLGIGFVNTTLILPRLLLPTQLGLLSVLVALATLGSKLAEVGFTNMALRYFPYFRAPESGHRGFLPLLLGVPLAVFTVVLLGMWLGRPLVLRWYSHGQDTALVAAHYGVMLGLAFCILLYNLLDAYAKSLFHTAFSSFLVEVVQRLLVVGSAALYAAGVLSFNGFVLAY